MNEKMKKIGTFFGHRTLFEHELNILNTNILFVFVFTTCSNRTSMCRFGFGPKTPEHKPNRTPASLVAPDQFNHENCWKSLHRLHTFLRNIDKVEEEEWASLLQFPDTDTENEADNNARADLSMISAFHARIYVCSSPIKP
jgi:hypothetical protein